MAKYRKKPIVIEARQWDGSPEAAEEIVGWIRSEGGIANVIDSRQNLPRWGIWILTLEGEIAASPSDYVIQGIQGEFYPCKPDIFRDSYDRVLDDVFSEESERLATPEELALIPQRQ